MAKDKSDKNWFARHKILTVIGAFIVVALIASAGSGDSGNSDGSTSNTSNVSQNKEFRFADRADKQDKDIEILPGEEATLEGMKLIVNSAERKTSLGQFSNAEAGKTFLVVNLTLENTGNSANAYNGFDFRVQTSGGQVLDQSFESIEPRLGSGDLVQGGKITGYVVFETPIEEGYQYVIWKPNAFSSDRVIIEVE